MNPTQHRRISIATHASCRLGVDSSALALPTGVGPRGHDVAWQPQRGHERDAEQSAP